MNEMLIHTSNIINWKSIKNNPQLTSTDEILKCSIQVLKCYMKNENLFANNKLSDVEVECINHKDLILDDRSDLRVNVKLFLINNNYEDISKHLAQIFKYLECNELDSLIISITPETICSSICMGDVYELWSKLEEYVKDHRILQLGVCDFTLEQLEDMWQSVEIKPSINQIYWKRMCSVSQSLKDFAADHHIQLLSHHDKPDILPSNLFKTRLQEIMPNIMIESVDPSWVCRYSIVYKNRSVIRSKGYISKVFWN